MADRVVLHVGLMKSGTSHIQGRLNAAAPTLGEHGLLFPGGRWGQQVVAVSDGIARRQRAEGEFDGAWQRMVAEIEAAPGTAVISMEFLGPPSPERLRPVVDSFPGTRVEAVLTVRDLGRTIPSMWQETLKNGRSWTWEAYVAGVRHRRGPGEIFWNEQDAGAIAAKWAALVGTDAVSVVTLPPPGADRELLWQRFCEAASLPVEAAPPSSRGNESLGAASAELLRRLNIALGADQMPWPAYSRVVKFGLAKTLLAEHRADEEPIGFTPRRWVREEAGRQQEAIAATGVRVVGDLADLEPVAQAGVRPGRDRLGRRRGSAELDAAVHALVRLLQQNVDRFEDEQRRKADGDRQESGR